MDKFFQDPILIIASLLFAGTLGILAWALMKLKEHTLLQGGDEFIDEDSQANNPASEATGLVEARLQEICNQLTEINQRLCELEQKQQPADATQSLNTAPSVDKETIEKCFQRIESRLESLAEQKQSSPDASVARLEGKLEGIHKLLILLTDSGSPEQK